MPTRSSRLDHAVAVDAARVAEDLVRTLVLPPALVRGARLLFGDHAMFFRREDFLVVGGCNPDAVLMEDAELCIAMSRLGRVRLVHRFVITSDRRMAQWGELRANWIALKIGISWALGRTENIARDYPTSAEHHGCFRRGYGWSRSIGVDLSACANS